MPPVLFAWPIENNSSRPLSLFHWTERTTSESVVTNTTEVPQTTLLGIGIIASVSGLILLGIATWLVIGFLRRRTQDERAVSPPMRVLKESEGMVQNRETRLSE